MARRLFNPTRTSLDRHTEIKGEETRHVSITYRRPVLRYTTTPSRPPRPLVHSFCLTQPSKTVPLAFVLRLPIPFTRTRPGIRASGGKDYKERSLHMQTAMLLRLDTERKDLIINTLPDAELAGLC